MEFEIVQWAAAQGVSTAVLGYVLVRLESQMKALNESNVKILTILEDGRKTS